MKYKVKLVILGAEWESSGATLDEALAGFKLDWSHIKGKGVLTVFYGDQSHEHLFNMARLRRIFSNKIIRMHWAKSLEYLLKADYKTNIPNYAKEIGNIDTTGKNSVPARRGRKAKGSTGSDSRDNETA